MPRPPNKEFDLVAKIAKMKAAGFRFQEHDTPVTVPKNPDKEMRPLAERIQFILRIIQNEPAKAITMNYLILYDIEKDKIRNLIAKYLLSRGCIRIQKSVFLAHSDHKKFDKIQQTLADINDIYQNEDSIILVPLNVSDARSMKLIGQNVNINQIIDPPNTIFI